MAARRPAREEGEGSVPSGGGLRARGLIAPLVSLVALIALAVGSFSLLSVSGPAQGAGAENPNPDQSQDPDATPGARPTFVFSESPRPTPNPTVIITPPPEQAVEVRGSVLFARTGNIWVATGRELRQLTSDERNESGPVWSPDGRTIYYIEMRQREARVRHATGSRRFTLNYPVIMKMNADGSGRAEVKSGIVRLGGPASNVYSAWMLQLDVSPDGRTLALVSDMPDPLNLEVTLSTMPTAGGRVRNLNVRQVFPLGHNDPAWSPDGKRIAFTYNARRGADGAPRIGIYTVATRAVTFLGGAGYAEPSWSPDGRRIAAVRTTGNGRDVVILDAQSGEQLVKATENRRSFSPVFSPDGREIAYLHFEGLGVDLRLMTLGADGITVESDKAVTDDGSLDPGSPPSWWMPPQQRAAPSASPAPSPSTRP